MIEQGFVVGIYDITDNECCVGICTHLDMASKLLQVPIETIKNAVYKGTIIRGRFQCVKFSIEEV